MKSLDEIAEYLYLHYEQDLVTWADEEPTPWEQLAPVDQRHWWKEAKELLDWFEDEDQYRTSNHETKSNVWDHGKQFSRPVRSNWIN